jgi:hypothetical protein
MLVCTNAGQLGGYKAYHDSAIAINMGLLVKWSCPPVRKHKVLAIWDLFILILVGIQIGGSIGDRISPLQGLV